MDITRETEIVELPTRSRIHWGAVIAGMFFVIAFGWLLSLLGGAIGVTIADSSDMEALGSGFGIGAAIWMAVTALLAYFIGGLLVARLSGEPDKTRGMLQGVTLWSLATVLTLVLGFMGVRSLMTAGANLVSTTAEVATSAVSGGVQAVGSVASGAGSLVSDALTEEVRGVLEDELTRAVARADDGQTGQSGQTGGASGGGGEGRVSQEDAERALEGLDAEVIQEAAAQLAAGNTEEARATMREATGLSEQEVESLVDGVASQMKESWSESRTREALEASFRSGLDDVAEGLADAGGPGVTETDIREAIQDLDGEILADVGRDLIAGRTESAKRTLARETALEREDIDALVSSASTAIDERVAVVREEADQAMEAASDYTEGVLWAWWIGAVLALVACAAGGAVGAATVERFYRMRLRERATA